MQRLASNRDEYAKRNIQNGELVMRRVLNRKSKIDPPWDGPFFVVASTDKDAFQLSSPNGYVLKNLINSARIRKLSSTEIEKYTGEFWQASERLKLHEQQLKKQATVSPPAPILSSNSTPDLSWDSIHQGPPSNSTSKSNISMPKSTHGTALPLRRSLRQR